MPTRRASTSNSASATVSMTGTRSNRRALCLRSGNRVPEFSWTAHLDGGRFHALAGWQKNDAEIFAVLNQVTHAIFSQFQRQRSAGQTCRRRVGTARAAKGSAGERCITRLGRCGCPSSLATMPPFAPHSVVDEDFRVFRHGPAATSATCRCMPLSSAANPVRTLAALALRLARHLG